MKQLPFTVSKQWSGQDVKVEGHIFKVEGQKVEITSQSTDSM